MTPKHSSNSVAAKDRKHIASPPPEYWDEPDYSKPSRRLTYEDLLTGQKHVFDLFISRNRIDQFRVEVDGKQWGENMGLSHVLAGLRKSIGRFGRGGK